MNIEPWKALSAAFAAGIVVTLLLGILLTGPIVWFFSHFVH